ncbi:MAG: hypothetical protein ACRDKW_10920, partial [Actinomycetota bacterium]
VPDVVGRARIGRPTSGSGWSAKNSSAVAPSPARAAAALGFRAEVAFADGMGELARAARVAPAALAPAATGQGSP